MKRRALTDTECYPNYWLIKFRNAETGGIVSYEIRDGVPLDKKSVRTILKNSTIITFNGIHYDMPMIMLALKLEGDPLDVCRKLKEANDWLILGQHKSWEFEKHFNVEVPKTIDHIDLIEVAFGQGSLKLYGGRLHSRKLQDLPLEVDTWLTEDQMAFISLYCGNDLETTGDLARHLKPQIELRELMGAGYGVDLRSKSDAQIAEAVIRSEVSKVLGERVYRPEIPPGTRFKYKPPKWMQFVELQPLLEEIAAADFVIGGNGSPIEPPALDGRTVKIGRSIYRMGIGGLHSSETSTANFADEDHILVDRDVASYYPAIILGQRLYPKHMGEAFLKVYKDIFDRRIASKRAGHKTTADTLKIVLNGSFGKFGSMWSALYAPDLMIQVTLTGQLALLMLIERLELHGIPVVSANTDGIVIKCHSSKRKQMLETIAWWEKITGFETEETAYKALYSRDVNNYLALKDKGGSKGKGAFAPVTMSKNPADTICTEAAVAFLEHGTPVLETILKCRDIRQFVTVRTVRGGAIKITATNYDDRLTPGGKRDALLRAGWRQQDPGPLKNALFTDDAWHTDLDVESAYRAMCGEDEYDYIGKVVRWYKAVGVFGPLHYKTKNKSGNRNSVPNSEGAKPLMELPDEFPSDVDYNYYVETANAILSSIGAWRDG